MEIPAINPTELSMLSRLQQNAAIAANPLTQVGAISESRVGNDSKLAFGGALKSVFDNVDGHQKYAEKKITAVELGQSDDLIGATVAAQKAQLSFSALMQVRNKMVTNFNDIIKMPI